MKTKLITEKTITKAHNAAQEIMDKSLNDVMQEIREILMKCDTTTSDDVMAQSTQEKLENPIYTKKLVFNVSHEAENAHPITLGTLNNVECISMSCDSKDFGSCLSSDIRINTKNKYNEWANAYATSFSTDFLRFLLCLMKEVIKDPKDKRKELYDRFCMFADDFDSSGFIKDSEKFEDALDLLEEATT